MQLLGVQLAETERAERRSVAALRKAWRDSAESLARLADLLVDGGLLMHHVRLTAAGVNLKDKEGTLKSQGLEAQLALVEKPLHAALLDDAGSFVKQVDRAFTMSQLLADSWKLSATAMPQDELNDLRAAWTKLRQASRDLQKELRPGSNLRRQLLLRGLEAARGQGSLASIFPVPEPCSHAARDALGTEGAMLWRLEEGLGSAWLLTHTGALLQCKFGHVSPASVSTQAILAESNHHAKTNLGDFLSFLSD